MIRRANVHLALGQHADALNFAEKTHLQHPNDFAPKLTMIDALIHLGRTEDATEMAEMILKKLRGSGVPDRHPKWVFSRLRKSFKALGKNQKVRTVLLLEKRNSSES